MRTVPLLLAVLSATGAAVAAEAADAKPARITLSATATCAKKQVYVRLTDGSVVQVTHAAPGRRLRAVHQTTHDLFLVARIHAPWKSVQALPGQTLVLTASGPAGETWRWVYRLRARQPLADPTDYLACLRPRTAGGSFADRMHAAPGAWRFTARIGKGSLAGSKRTLALPSL